MNPPTLFCTTFTLYLYTFVCTFFLFNFKCSQSILNERIFEKNDIIRFVATWSIFRNFLGFFFIFLNSNLNFELGRFDSAVSGPVPVGKKNLASNSVRSDQALPACSLCGWLAPPWSSPPASERPGGRKGTRKGEESKVLRCFGADKQMTHTEGRRILFSWYFVLIWDQFLVLVPENTW